MLYWLLCPLTRDSLEDTSALNWSQRRLRYSAQSYRLFRKHADYDERIMQPYQFANLLSFYMTKEGTPTHTFTRSTGINENFQMNLLL